MSVERISIALDGPAGAGKSTIAKMIASIKNLLYIDTGAMYRAITLKIIKTGIPVEDYDAITELLNNTVIEMTESDVILDGEIVTFDIRHPNVSNLVSSIAKIPSVREKMVELQRQMANHHNVIMDGRDIGTNVLPNATHKFFLTASLDERARRRYDELVEKGHSIDLEDVRVEMALRDKIDSEREINPLRKAVDAIIIDTTSKTINEVILNILSYTN